MAPFVTENDTDSPAWACFALSLLRQQGWAGRTADPRLPEGRHHEVASYVHPHADAPARPGPPARPDPGLRLRGRGPGQHGFRPGPRRTDQRHDDHAGYRRPDG